MRETTPKVHLIAEPILNTGAIQDYLKSIGGEDWADAKLNGNVGWAELLVEFAGRLCYRSWKPGLNANVKKVRAESKEYLHNILKSRHGSVLEHANFTFVFDSVSRVFTHELVRHRAGVAISQESLRYVRLTDLGFRIPDVLRRSPSEDGDFEQSIVTLVETLEEFQVKAAERFGLDDDGIPFHVKKEVTSALRRLAPIGLSTSMVWTANIRTLRHVIESRTALGAEEEIRLVFQEVGSIMKSRCPNLFQDFELNAYGEWVPEFSKV